eukprot:scaffold21958_cov66-Phaeocystis_antarctica.AAC.4
MTMRSRRTERLPKGSTPSARPHRAVVGRAVEQAVVHGERGDGARVALERRAHADDHPFVLAPLDHIDVAAACDT